MAFFENLSEALSTKGKEAAEAAKKVAEIANLKNQINGINAEIKKNYVKIGEAYYEVYKNSEVTCEFEENVQAIRDAKKAVEELENKILELKGDVKCSGCGDFIPADSAFCPKCGTKVEVEVEVEAEAECCETEVAQEFTEEFITPEEKETTAE